MNWKKIERVVKSVAWCVIAVSLLIIAVVMVSYRLKPAKPPVKHYQIEGDGSYDSPFQVFDPQTGDLYTPDDRFKHHHWMLHKSFPSRTGVSFPLKNQIKAGEK